MFKDPQRFSASPTPSLCAGGRVQTTQIIQRLHLLHPVEQLYKYRYVQEEKKIRKIKFIAERSMKPR